MAAIIISTTSTRTAGSELRRRLMSALGHKRTWRDVTSMSAITPKADIAERTYGAMFNHRSALNLVKAVGAVSN